MFRWIFLESLVAATLLLLVSVGTFVAFDRLGTQDWYGTIRPGLAIGLTRQEALATDRPRLLFSHDVDDAQSRTLRDLALLAHPATRVAARARLLARGTVIVPVALAALNSPAAPPRDDTLRLLAELGPILTGREGDLPPADPSRAREWWATFMALHEIDLRDAFARRHVQRLAEHDSPNAREQLGRLGTLALPALFEALEGELDAPSARRLCDLASDLAGIERRIPSDASADRTRAIVEQWRAWWFARRLEYVRLGQVRRRWGRVTESRYALWLRRALDGRLGPSAATGVPVHVELRARLPVSTLLAGLGSLCATALVVAFGGGDALRRRPLSTKLLDLIAAFVPGLLAFSIGFLALCFVCADRRSALDTARIALSHGPRMLLAIASVAALTSLFLRRRKARVVLQAVRVEAETWADRHNHPRFTRWLRHGWRVGVASLLAPAALNAFVVLGLTLLVEPLTGLAGMGELTLRSLRRGDGAWLQIAALSMVPVAMATRWARNALYWALGAKEVAFTRSSDSGTTADTL
jgi:ABC-type dipeptide/oligopeptide/nickel transport system permease component